MPRIIDQPIAVTLGPNREPLMFTWRRQRYQVAEVLDSWREVGAWWDKEGEKTTFRVRTRSNGMFELTFDLGQGRWYLYKAYD